MTLEEKGLLNPADEEVQKKDSFLRHTKQRKTNCFAAILNLFSFSFLFGFDLDDDSFFGGRLDGFTLNYIFLFLFVSVALLSVFKISARSKHRFSITSLFYSTTIISIYAAIYSSVGKQGPALQKSVEIYIIIFLAYASFVCINRIAGNCLYFIEDWPEKRDYWQEIVPSSWCWSSHIYVAFVVLVLWVIVRLINVLPLSESYFFCMIFAISMHINAVQRTAISACREGIKFVGKFWRWEEGRLELFEDEGIYRLGPRRIVNERKWGKWLWPEVPAENLGAVREVLNRHYEQDT